MKSPRKRAIAKAELREEKYEAWKEMVQAVGGSLYKDKFGKVHGRMYIN